MSSDLTPTTNTVPCTGEDCQVCEALPVREATPKTEPKETRTFFNPFRNPGEIIEMSDGTKYRVSERGNWVKLTD